MGVFNNSVNAEFNEIKKSKTEEYKKYYYSLK
jgi:hypothetical protein